MHGTWPDETFCRAVHQQVLGGRNYFITVKLFIQGVLKGEGTNYAGLMFNAKDENNYDFIYFM